MNLGSSPLANPRVTTYPVDMSRLELPGTMRWWTTEDYQGIGLFGVYPSPASDIRAQAFWGMTPKGNPKPYGFYLTDPISLFPCGYVNPDLRIAKMEALDPFGNPQVSFAVTATPFFAGTSYTVGVVKRPSVYAPGQNYTAGPYVSMNGVPSQWGPATPFGLNGVGTHLLIAVCLEDRIRIQRLSLVFDPDTFELLELTPDGYTEWVHGYAGAAVQVRQQYVGGLDGVMRVEVGAGSELRACRVILDADGYVVAGDSAPVQVRPPYGENLLHGYNPDDGTVIFTQAEHVYLGCAFGTQILDPIDILQPYDPRNNRYLWEPSQIKWLPLLGAGPQTLARRYYADKNRWAYFGMFTMLPPGGLA